MIFLKISSIKKKKEFDIRERLVIIIEYNMTWRAPKRCRFRSKRVPNNELFFFLQSKKYTDDFFFCIQSPEEAPEQSPQCFSKAPEKGFCEVIPLTRLPLLKPHWTKKIMSAF